MRQCHFDDWREAAHQIIANPDLTERFLANPPLNKIDWPTVYASGQNGYIDYPTLEVLATVANR